jgi:hypothetical protein
MAGGGCAKRRDAKFDIKFEMARIEALRKLKVRDTASTESDVESCLKKAAEVQKKILED